LDVNSQTKKQRYESDAEIKELPINNPLPTSTENSVSALVPVGRRLQWDPSQWSKRRSQKFESISSNKFESISPNKFESFPIQNKFEGFTVPVSSLKSLDSKLLNSSPQTSGALVLYRPLGTPGSEQDVDDQSVSQQQAGSTLYSSPHCTVELLPDDDSMVS